MQLRFHIFWLVKFDHTLNLLTGLRQIDKSIVFLYTLAVLIPYVIAIFRTACKEISPRLAAEYRVFRI